MPLDGSQVNHLYIDAVFFGQFPGRSQVECLAGQLFGRVGGSPGPPSIVEIAGDTVQIAATVRNIVAHPARHPLREVACRSGGIAQIPNHGFDL